MATTRYKMGQISYAAYGKVYDRSAEAYDRYSEAYDLVVRLEFRMSQAEDRLRGALFGGRSPRSVGRPWAPGPLC